MKNLDSCGCCEGLSTETPLKVYNRPNLGAIAYRVGDHAKFKESLLTALSDPRFPALRRLTTRSDDDFSIALLDAWAVVSDVLTFYQERIANESYLSTATEQFSIVELARLIGYELRPGVAASTYLAFTIEDNTMTAGQIAVTGNKRSEGEIPPTIITVGTKVQSVPGPDEEPQTFETIEKLEARPEWNAIKPRLGQIHAPLSITNIIVIEGTDNNVKAGDIFLIDINTAVKVVKVTLDEESKTTSLYFKSDATYLSFVEPALTELDALMTFQGKLSDENVKKIINITKGWHQEDLSAIIQTQGWSAVEFKESLSKVLFNKITEGGAFSVFRKRTFPFGHNALKQVTYTARGVPNPASTWVEWDRAEVNTKIYLDAPYEQILKDSHIAVQIGTNRVVYNVDDVDIESRTAYGMSLKATLITIRQKNSNWWGADASNLGAIRSITIHAQSEPLKLAQSPITNTVSGKTIMLDSLYLGLKKGQPVMLFGERTDLSGTHAAEFRKLKEVYVINGFTTIELESALDYTYIRKTVSINANVAAATHGETVKEVLGSGDAGKTFQKFVLKQPPLTFTSANTPSGTQSTLEIRVNDLLWREVPSLYEREAHEHIYITRQDDLGKTTVIFGDGKNGARLPTAQENIRATYRKGIGTKGLLKAHQLSQLLTRPLGAKAVTNPLITSGAQDKENLADARRNANLTIFTLERIVSLQDYEDFARAFAGIAKSLATWTWHGQKRFIHLTVAGYKGAEVAKTSQLYDKLLNAIQKASIPDVPVVLASYTPRFFQVEAKVSVHADYESDKVLAAVKTRLREKFSFAERGFGQSVAFSEVMATIQNTEGVKAVDIDRFYRSDGVQPINGILFSAAPSPGLDTATPDPAELLTLDSRPIVLNLMK